MITFVRSKGEKEEKEQQKSALTALLIAEDALKRNENALSKTRPRDLQLLHISDDDAIDI